ncbi:MAG: hypothetical protein Q9214_005487 [Letrouitia sp. 1 TL-2023]
MRSIPTALTYQRTAMQRPRGIAPSLQHLLRPTIARSHKSLVTRRAITDNSVALNPPASTLPPPLELPEKRPDQAKIKYFYRLGKAYVGFYKAGIKAVYHNYKLARQIQGQIPHGLSREAALQNGSLTRASYQLLLRTRRDLARIPLFALVLTVCGEFTPIVVVFMGLSKAVPRTCWVPKQVLGAQQKLEERRRRSFRDGTIAPDQQPLVEQLPSALLHIGRSLALYSEWWDRVGLMPPLLDRRVKKRLEQLDLDDHAISRDGGVAYLKGEEVELAASDRGLDVLGRPEEEVRAVLQRWLIARKKHSAFKLLLNRPSAWQDL